LLRYRLGVGRTGVALGVTVLLAGALAGLALVPLAFNQTAADPDPPAPEIPSPPDEPDAVRLLIPGMARDAPMRVFVTELSRDRPDPKALRLLVAGDSTAVYMGSSLAAMARSAGGEAVAQFKTSSGLSRPDFFDWPGYLRTEVPRFAPNVVVLMFGANDPQGIRTPEGMAVQPLSPEWRAEYARRVDETIDLVSSGGRLVVVVGQPIMEAPAFDERMRAVNAIYEEVCAARDDAVYVDAHALFAAQDGSYQGGWAGEDGSYRAMRAPDGIHFTGAGGQYLAAHVFEVIEAHGEWTFEQ
jgi:hypothetical protein